jgi:hypothetical protein
MADRAESENTSSPTEATAGPARRVFISYASHYAAVAQKVCSALEGVGFPCWMAPRCGTRHVRATCHPSKGLSVRAWPRNMH